jgi:hypothetical protein
VALAQDSVELPEPPVTDADDNVHDRLVELVVTDKATVPVKLFTGAMAMVEVPCALASTIALVGLADIVKSWTTKVTEVEWDRLPFVPVTPTWSVPVDVNLHDRLELPEPVTLVGDKAHDVLFVVKLISPEKPLTAVTVIVVVAVALTFTVTLVGLALIEKSWTT